MLPGCWRSVAGGNFGAIVFLTLLMSTFTCLRWIKEYRRSRTPSQLNSVLRPSRGAAATWRGCCDDLEAASPGQVASMKGRRRAMVCSGRGVGKPAWSSGEAALSPFPNTSERSDCYQLCV